MSSTEQIDWGHWILRLVAYIIDGLIFAVIAFVVGFIIPWGFIFVIFLWGLLLVLYFAILDVYWGASIGKRLLGIHVQTINGGKVPFDKAFIRNISKIFPPFLVLDWLIGIVTPGDKRQKFLDRYVGITFVRTGQSFATTSQSYPPPPPPPPPP